MRSSFPLALILCRRETALAKEVFREQCRTSSSFNLGETSVSRQSRTHHITDRQMLATWELRRIDRVRVVHDLVMFPSGRMTGEANTQRHAVVIGATRLRDVRTLFVQQLRAFVAGSHDRDVPGLVIVMVLVGRQNQPALVGIVLSLGGTTDRSP